MSRDFLSRHSFHPRLYTQSAQPAQRQVAKRGDKQGRRAPELRETRWRNEASTAGARFIPWPCIRSLPGLDSKCGGRCPAHHRRRDHRQHLWRIPLGGTGLFHRDLRRRSGEHYAPVEHRRFRRPARAHVSRWRHRHRGGAIRFRLLRQPRAGGRSPPLPVGGQSAFVSFVSPGQVDALLPSGINAGRQALTVGRAGSISAPYSLEVSTTQPGLWAPASFNAGGRQYAAAVFLDYRTFVLPPGTIPGVVSRQAHPGETIILLGTGFGAVTPDIPAGRIVTELNQVVSPLTFSFGETPVTPAYAGLMPSGGAVGLYQFNLVVPAIPDNDAVPLTFTLGGVPGTQTLFIAVNATTAARESAVHHRSR